MSIIKELRIRSVERFLEIEIERTDLSIVPDYKKSKKSSKGKFALLYYAQGYHYIYKNGMYLGRCLTLEGKELYLNK